MHPRGIPPTQARRHVAGFTAIELMVVVSIVAILAALAVSADPPRCTTYLAYLSRVAGSLRHLTKEPGKRTKQA